MNLEITAKTNTCDRTRAGFPVDSIAPSSQKKRYISIPRGEMRALIYGAIERSVETIFHDNIASVDDTLCGVRVMLDSGKGARLRLVHWSSEKAGSSRGAQSNRANLARNLALCRTRKAAFNAAQGDLGDANQLCPRCSVGGLNAKACYY